MPPPSQARSSPVNAPASPNLPMLLRMTRPGSLLLTVAACVLGLSFAPSTGQELDALKAAATLVLALMAHAGANVLNDYQDARNGADAANQHGLFPFSGGSRLIQQGLVSEAHTARWAAVLLAALIPGGLLLALHSGPGLLLVGAVGLLLAWAYSSPPFALMCRGVGELAIAAAWWLVVLGADYVQQGHFSTAPAVTAIAFSALAANILLINGFADAASDAQVGKNTVVVQLGLQLAAWLYAGVVVLAYGVLCLVTWQGWAPNGVWAGMTSLPLSMAAAALLVRHATSPQRLRPAIALTICAALVHALAIAAGLVL